MAGQVVGWSQWFNNEVQRTAESAFKQLVATGGGELYLYFKRGQGSNVGALAVAVDAPEGFELAAGERIPGNLTLPQLTGWIHQRSTRLEILPPG